MSLNMTKQELKEAISRHLEKPADRQIFWNMLTAIGQAFRGGAGLGGKDISEAVDEAYLEKTQIQIPKSMPDFKFKIRDSVKVVQNMADHSIRVHGVCSLRENLPRFDYLAHVGTVAGRHELDAMDYGPETTVTYDVQLDDDGNIYEFLEAELELVPE
jgi:hypothetical protein